MTNLSNKKAPERTGPRGCALPFAWIALALLAWWMFKDGVL
jgi:hypothetical protein